MTRSGSTRSTRASASPTRPSGASAPSCRRPRTSRATFTYDNREAYVQDNWKVNRKWTIDYGVRFVHAIPQHDALGCRAATSCRTSGCSPHRAALYVPGCVGDTATCTGSNRSAKNPLTGELLGPNTTLAIGTLVPNTGVAEERPVPVWEGHRGHDLLVPEVERRPALRHGLRSVGRPARRPARIARPLLRPAARRQRTGARGQHVRLEPRRPCGTRSCRACRASPTQSPAQLTAYQYESEAADIDGMERRRPGPDPLGHDGRRRVRGPSQLQRRAEPRQHQFGRPRHGVRSQQAGSDHRPQRDAGRLVARGAVSRSGASVPRLHRDRLSACTTDGATYHAIQFSINRRFRNGISFGFNDAVTLRDIAQIAPALRPQRQRPAGAPRRPGQRHRSFSRTSSSRQHFMKATALWQLPIVKADERRRSQRWGGSSTTGSCRRCGRVPRAHRTRSRSATRTAEAT